MKEGFTFNQATLKLLKIYTFKNYDDGVLVRKVLIKFGVSISWVFHP